MFPRIGHPRTLNMGIDHTEGQIVKVNNQGARCCVRAASLSSCSAPGAAFIHSIAARHGHGALHSDIATLTAEYIRGGADAAGISVLALQGSAPSVARICNRPRAAKRHHTYAGLLKQLLECDSL
jgi:hypothetical protein